MVAGSWTCEFREDEREKGSRTRGRPKLEEARGASLSRSEPLLPVDGVNMSRCDRALLDLGGCDRGGVKVGGSCGSGVEAPYVLERMEPRFVGGSGREPFGRAGREPRRLLRKLPGQAVVGTVLARMRCLSDGMRSTHQPDHCPCRWARGCCCPCPYCASATACWASLAGMLGSGARRVWDGGRWHR